MNVRMRLWQRKHSRYHRRGWWMGNLSVSDSTDTCERSLYWKSTTFIHIYAMFLYSRMLPVKTCSCRPNIFMICAWISTRRFYDASFIIYIFVIICCLSLSLFAFEWTRDGQREKIYKIHSIHNVHTHIDDIECTQWHAVRKVKVFIIRVGLSIEPERERERENIGNSNFKQCVEGNVCCYRGE